MNCPGGAISHCGSQFAQPSTPRRTRCLYSYSAKRYSYSRNSYGAFEDEDEDDIQHDYNFNYNFHYDYDYDYDYEHEHEHEHEHERFARLFCVSMRLERTTHQQTATRTTYSPRMRIASRTVFPASGATSLPVVSHSTSFATKSPLT